MNEGLTQRVSSPNVARDSLAGVAVRIAGELALEGAGERESAAPFHFGRCGGERLVGRLRRAVDHEAFEGQSYYPRDIGTFMAVSEID